MHGVRPLGEHRLEDLLSQRVYALALGHEDLNDHEELRHDPVLQTATSRMETLASPSTLCRPEQRADRETAVAVHQALFEQFVKAHATPRRLVLDIDATDHAVARRAGKLVLPRLLSVCAKTLTILPKR